MFVRGELTRRWSSQAVVTSLSVRASHRYLLDAWMADDIAPLERQAAERWRAAVEGRVTLLRNQCARWLEQRVGQSLAPTAHGDAMHAIRGIRDVQSALERACRANLGIVERRTTVVRAILDLADERGFDLRALSPSELAEPARREADRIVAGIEQVRTQAIKALTEASRAAGVPEPLPSVDALYDVPVLDLPPFPSPRKAPWWAELASGLTARWEKDDVRAQWEPQLEHAVAAYLDLLRGWARRALDAIRGEVESQSRVLLGISADAEPSGGVTPARDVISAGLDWLKTHRRPSPEGCPPGPRREATS